MSFQRSGNFHKQTVFRSLSLLFIFWLTLASLSFAQGDASIQGIVTDPSGGAIQGVSIQIKNVETGAIRNLITDETGRYDAASLPVGRYVVRAEKPGFRSEEKTGISVALGQSETVNVLLQVGDVRQVVHVEAAPTIVVIGTRGLSGVRSTIEGRKKVKPYPPVVARK